MSGICLFFSLKKTNGKHILSFYKRRFSKIFKIYFLLCIPWTILLTIVKNKDLIYFINISSIIGKEGGYFWFINFIMVCYLLYPLVYKLIENNKSWIILSFIVLYFIFLCFLNSNYYDFFSSYQRVLVRLIPFLIGCLLGKSVYEKRTIKQRTIVISLILLCLREAILTLIKKGGTFMPFYITINYTYFTILAFATIFLIIILFTVFKLPKIEKIFANLGLFSLEMYVVHYALIDLVSNKVFFNIQPKNTTQLILFFLIFPISAIVISKSTQIILNCIPPCATIGFFAKPSSKTSSSSSSPSDKTLQK